jgi:hypothetical protein
VPLGATLSEFAEGNPSEIPSRTQSVSAFLFGKFSKGPRSFGKTLRDLTHPLMGNNRILCSLDARCQEASFLALQGRREDEKIRWVPGNDGMELAAAAFAAHDIADDKGLLIDRLFTRPVDCCLCHHD